MNKTQTVEEQTKTSCVTKKKKKLVWIYHSRVIVLTVTKNQNQSSRLLEATGTRSADSVCTSSCRNDIFTRCDSKALLHLLTLCLWSEWINPWCSGRRFFPDHHRSVHFRLQKNRYQINSVAEICFMSLASFHLLYAFISIFIKRNNLIY